MKEIGYQPIEWLGNKVKLLDQTRLPWEEVYLELSDYQEVASAIKEMRIRGAPAIGVAGAYGIALGALKIEAASRDEFLLKLKDIMQTLAATRPTARNLFVAIDRMQQAAGTGGDMEQIKKALVSEAARIHSEEAEATGKLARFGAELIKDGATILTHCNTGPLATAGYGTALGVIRQASPPGS